MRDWLNKETRDRQGILYEGLGIINPPDNASKDLRKYPKEKTL